MQPRRDCERRVHSHHAGVEVELGHALEAARRTFFDAHAAAFAVVDQNLVQAVRTLRPHDARLGTDQITVVAGVAGAAAEAAAGLLDRLLLRERLNHFLLRSAPAGGRQHRLLHAREVREVRHVHAVQIKENVDRNRARLQLFPRSTLSRLNATRLPSPTAFTTISGWPEPSCTTSPAAKKFVSPRRPNRSILIVPRSVLKSSCGASWGTSIRTR